MDGIRRPALWAIVLTTAALAAVPVSARTHRSHAARDAFERAQHCPSTGNARGSCPGWIIDHVKPLCAGGADDPSNMQWQTVSNAKAKDRLERARCRSLRRAPPA